MYFEQRQTPRVPFSTRAYVENDTMNWITPLLDISRGGILLIRPKGWLPGDNIHTCTIPLSKDQKITIKTKVRHFDRYRIGLRLEEEPDNIDQLRKLIELNLNSTPKNPDAGAGYALN